MTMTENYEDVNHLVLNFYPDGYSIAVKLNEFPVFTSETILETAKIPYDETGLLDYIANEELPPLLVEMIDNSPKLSQYKIWRNGCLILEVRDKIESTSAEESKSTSSNNIRGISGIKNTRTNNNNNSNSNSNSNDKNNHQYKRSQSSAKASQIAQTNLSQTSHWFQNLATTTGYNQHENHNHHPPHHPNIHQNGIEQDHVSPETHFALDVKQEKRKNYFVVLKPTNLSMLYDVLNLTSSKCWSAQQRLQLESQIVLYNSPRLYLEPDAPTIPPPNSKIESQSDVSMIAEDNDEEGADDDGDDGDDSDDDSELDSKAHCATQDRRMSYSLGVSSNKYSKFNGFKPQPQQKLSHKTRLKNIYLNRPISVTQLKTNGISTSSSNSKNHHPKMNNIYHNPSSGSNNTNTNTNTNNNNNNNNSQHQTTNASLPPELTLQQFLATKRATSKRKPFPTGQNPRFHRFKKHHK